MLRRHTLCSLLAAATIPVPAFADTYYFRPKPAVLAVAAPAEDREPDAFSVPEIVGAEPGATIISVPVELTGHTGVEATVAGDASARIRACADEGCSTTPVWVAGSVSVPPSATSRSWVQTSVTAGALRSPTSVLTVTAGTTSSEWKVTARDSAIRTSTANLPEGWSLEYVPDSSGIVNAINARGPMDVSLLRDGDLDTVAWRYLANHRSLDVALHQFSEPFRAEKCLVAWSNPTSSAASLRLTFSGGNDFPPVAVTSQPGTNFYNGPCLYTTAGARVYLSMAYTGPGPVISVSEFRVGK